MKQVSLILSVLAFIGVLVLFGMRLSGSNPKTATTVKTASGVPVPAGNRVAYVDIDTFEANFSLLKNKKKEFETQQTAMENELQRSVQQMQSRANALQQKAQAGTLSQAEGEAAQKQLLQMQQSLETRKQAMNEQLLQAQEKFSSDIHKQLDDFLADYNKDKGYDYILSFSRANPVILFADKGLDITRDVIKGMNEKGGTTTNTTKGK